MDIIRYISIYKKIFKKSKDRKITPIPVDFSSLSASSNAHSSKLKGLMNCYYDTVHTKLSRNTLQIISTEPKLNGNSRKHFVSPNILEAHDSRIRIVSIRKEKKE